MRAEQLTARVHHHGEGPVWSERWRGVRWVDMLAGDVLELDADGTVHRRQVGTVACVVRPLADRGWLAVREHDIVIMADDDLMAAPQPWVRLLDDPAFRLNEGGCTPDGVLLVGTMAYDTDTVGSQRARLYRVDPATGDVTTALDQVTISNGLEFTPDGSTAYYVDTPTGRIDAFDHDPVRGLSGRRRFVEIPEDAGGPDGLTVDAEGGVWVALWGGGAVRHYSAGGELDEVVEVPGACQVTAVTLGGTDRRTLYITTSRQGLDDDAEPAAGSLFTATSPVAGQPVRPMHAPADGSRS